MRVILLCVLLAGCGNDPVAPKFVPYAVCPVRFVVIPWRDSTGAVFRVDTIWNSREGCR